MCVRWHCYLACTACNNQFYSYKYQQFASAETEAEILEWAKSEGWERREVPNGSTWDFCPRCNKEPSQ